VYQKRTSKHAQFSAGLPATIGVWMIRSKGDAPLGRCTLAVQDPAFDDLTVGCWSRAKGWPGLVYDPHPETKPEHFQAADVLAILCPYGTGVRYGMGVDLIVDRRRIQFQRDV